jgi:hypothetical protein
MEAGKFSETLVFYHITTQRRNKEYHDLGSSLMWQTKFHTPTKRQVKLHFII